MRVLVANGEFLGAGGVETYLSILVPALQAAGHDVGILHDRSAADGGAQAIAPPGVWRAGVEEEGLETALARVRDFAPDVCFSNNMRALAIDARLAAAWPVVKMMHAHTGTCVSGQKMYRSPSIVACTRTFGPGCLACYLPRRCGRANPLNIAREYRWGLEQRSLFLRYRAMVVASRYMRDEYLRAGAPPERMHVIPLFAPPHHEAARSPDDGRPIDVVFVGRMTRLKGADVLVDAVARASARLGRSVTAVFAGDGPERERLREQAAARGIDARFPGWVSPQQRDDLLRRAAMIVVPSLWPEPFALVGLEAGVFATPAVAFDSGGIADWLIDGENGRLVPPGLGAAGLADAIAGVLEDTAVRRRLGAGARAVAARLTLDRHLHGLTQVLETARGAAVP
jgi:glycosyltransferase involved in cell wall biosynthesis